MVAVLAPFATNVEAEALIVEFAGITELVATIAQDGSVEMSDVPDTEIELNAMVPNSVFTENVRV